MKGFAHLLIALILVSCTEPFTFQKGELTIDVIDAKISTIEGRSYISIYRKINDTLQVNLSDFDVNVVSEGGNQYAFVLDTESNTYRPEEASFRGEPGSKYKLEAISLEGQLYESSFDSIPIPVDISIGIKDTIISSFIDAGNINRRSATAALAELPQLSSPTYTKMEFSYYYIDFFSQERVQVKNRDEFILYSCISSAQCNDPIDIPVGVSFADEWYFINPPACDEFIRANPGVQLIFTEVCPFPCCQFEDDWDTDFEIIFESMSLEAYTYWENLEKLRNNDGLVFDTFPFALRGNVVCETCPNEVVGLFRAVGETIEVREVRL